MTQVAKKPAEENESLIIKSCGCEVIIDKSDHDSLNGINIKVNRKGYVYFCKLKATGNKTDLLHRYLLGLTAGDGFDVDHINGNPLDNRRSNLRKCTHCENMRNIKLNIRNKLKVKGVCYDKERKKYASYIKVNGKTINLGRYDDIQKAHSAYCEASKKYHGEFGRVE
jgi:hypothetical protein